MNLLETHRASCENVFLTFSYFFIWYFDTSDGCVNDPWKHYECAELSMHR